MTSEPKQTMDTPYPVCSDLTKVASLLKEFGVCVIPNVFSNSECDSWMHNILSNIESISGNQVDHNQPDLWTEDKLPPQVRYGLYHNILNNTKSVWEIRRDPRMKSIFKQVYSELKGKEVDEFVCSIDGINIQPNNTVQSKSRTSGEKDGPHCDQTKRNDIFKCVQGQVVLTNTQACFRATPGSHKHFRDIMQIANIPNNDSNRARFDDEQVEIIKRRVTLPNNLHWQEPIRTNKGSVILWFSTTVHSGMQSKVKEIPTKDDPFKGWRGIVYVCYRPKSEFTMDQLKVLEDCLESNRGTNHWATKVFPLPFAKGTQNLSPALGKLVSNPQLVYEVIKFKPERSSFLINQPIPMTSYEDKSNKIKTEEEQSIIKCIQNENNWPSLSDASHFPGNKGNTKAKEIDIRKNNSHTSSPIAPQSSQSRSNEGKKGKSIVQGAAWNSNK